MQLRHKKRLLVVSTHGAEAEGSARSGGADDPLRLASLLCDEALRRCSIDDNISELVVKL